MDAGELFLQAVAPAADSQQTVQFLRCAELQLPMEPDAMRAPNDLMTFRCRAAANLAEAA
jgi:hypothetical protein